MDLRKSYDQRGPPGLGSSPTRGGLSSTGHRYVIERSPGRGPPGTSAERGRGGPTSPYSSGPYPLPGARPATAAYGGPDPAASGRVDERHEELKRQIALKEKLLNDMKADRESTRRLRYANGNKSSGPGTRHDTINQAQQSVASLRTGSPTRGPPTASFTGMRSTHLMSGTGMRSYERDPGFETGLPAHQQLQLSMNTSHPAAFTAGGSPLRAVRTVHERNSRSRSLSKGRVIQVRVDEAGNAPFTSSYVPNRVAPVVVRETIMTRPGGSPIRSRSPVKPLPEPMVLPAIGGPVEGRDRLYRERIEAMTLDNAGLQRRLNHATADMQRARLDVEGMVAQLRAMEQTNDNTHRTAGHRDETDMSNQVLQDELDRRKEENRQMQARIAEEQGSHAATHQRLDNTNMSKQNLEFDATNMHADLRKKLHHIEDLSRELASVSSRINLAGIELENLNRDDVGLNHECIDLSTVIARVQAERTDAAQRVHEITMTLDELLHNNESDRHQLELRRRWQSKLVTSRIVEQMLTKLINARSCSAYQELREYSKFDKNCHNKLKAFAKVAHRLGLYRLRRAVNKWYDASLKPLASIGQNQDIALMGECNRLQAKCFYAWRQHKQNQENRYKLKANGVDRLWHILVRDGKQKKKRAMAIWKEGLQSVDQRMYSLKMVLRKIHEKNIRKAFSSWLGYNCMVEQAVRLRVLHIDASQQLMLSQTFHQLKLACHRERTMRLRSLRHTVKAWRAAVRYNRNLMLVNMSAIQFVQSNQRYVLKNCFDELRMNKEARKHKLLQHAVHQEVNPAISALESYSYDKSSDILQQNKVRACRAIKDQLARRLHTYMKKWMKESGHYKISLKSALAARITRSYYNNLLFAFARWRRQLLKRETQLRTGINDALAVTVDGESQTAHKNESYLRLLEDQTRSHKRVLVAKTMRKFQDRRLAVAIGRWMDICNMRTTQEDRLASVIKRYRNRQLRCAINSYVVFLKWSRQHDKNMNGMLYLRHKANMRLMQKVFDAMAWYTERNKRAHHYWSKILNRMDAFMRTRAIHTWRQNAGISYEKELMGIQDQMTDSIYKRNQLLCSMEKHVGEQDDHLAGQKKLRRDRAYRIVGNYFVRTQKDRMVNVFRDWRFTVQQKKHKQKLIARTLNHWKRHQFHMAAMMFKKWVNKDHQRIYNEELLKKKNEQNLLNDKLLIEKQTHDENVEMFKGTLQALDEDISIRKNRAAKLMYILERRNREWTFISRQRQIFNEWRHCVKQQTGFCQALESILQKKMYMKGLHYIKNAAKRMEYENRVHRHLRIYAQKRQRFSCNDAFNCWKLWSLQRVDERTNSAILALKARNAEFQDYVKLVKRTNAARVFRYLQETSQANVFAAWRNVVKEQRQLKANALEFQERRARMQKVNAIEKWYLRKCNTLRRRQEVEHFQRRMHYKTMRLTFKGLKGRFNIDKGLNNGCHRLERFMREKIFQDGFKSIKSWGISKQKRHGKDKLAAAEMLRYQFLHRYGTDLENGWQQLKNQIFKHRRQKETLKRAVAQVIHWRTRMAFMRWREQDNKEALLDDNYYIGPVRAEQWEANREIDNLKGFMRHEQFDEDHIGEVVAKVEKGSKDLMHKFCSRMLIKRHPQKRILPWFLDRWKRYVALRKLYAYKFRLCHNRTNNVRADLQYAFNRWKDKPLHLRSQLGRLSTPMLKEISLLTTKKVDQCGDQLYENQSISNHLMVQRDEFLNYYIKSQILAMALVKDRARNTQMQSWGRWFDKQRALKKIDLQRDIRDAAYLHANLQAQRDRYEKKNQELKTENEELTQFTRDAKVVSNNHLSLKKQTTSITIEISTTDEEYYKLVEKNELLKRLVAEAEGASVTRKNRKYTDLYTIKYHDEKDGDEQENVKPAGERKEHLFTKEKEDGGVYETEQEKKTRDRFKNLTEKMKGSSIR